MTFQKFKRTDSMVGSKASFVTLRPDRIAFNSEFVKEAELKKFSNAIVLFDPENYKIGFQFHNSEEDKDSFAMHTDSTTKNSRNISGQSIYKKYKWIDSISKLSDNNLKRFKPKYDNIEKIWVITLMPSFENKASNISKIPSSVVGIYRYIRDSEIVYIGKGEIKTRANSPERTTWEFDKIEYSIITDPDLQAQWESYWLDKFVEINDRLPIYNKILGKKN